MTKIDGITGKKVEKKLKESEHKLKERIKELNCLYGISKLIEEPKISIENIINGTLNLIPPAWQYSHITRARIIYDNDEYKTENFKETKWKISTSFKINGKNMDIEVFYLEDKPFLEDELNLINDIGSRLKSIIEIKIAEQKSIEAEEKLRMFMDSATDGFVILDPELYYIDVNNVTLEILGMNKEELIGKNILDIAPGLKETGRYDKYLDVLKTGKPFSTEDVIFNSLDGSI